MSPYHKKFPNIKADKIKQEHPSFKSHQDHVQHGMLMLPWSYFQFVWSHHSPAWPEMLFWIITLFNQAPPQVSCVFSCSQSSGKAPQASWWPSGLRHTPHNGNILALDPAGDNCYMSSAFLFSHISYVPLDYILWHEGKHTPQITIFRKGLPKVLLIH